MKLHLVVRADLSPAQRAVQAAHALREFVREHPDEDRLWYETSNTVALLEVPDEAALTQLLSKAQICGIPFSGFREPDRADELTAAAIGPSGKRLCRGLPLALAERGVRAIICTPTIAEPTSTAPTASPSPTP